MGSGAQVEGGLRGMGCLATVNSGREHMGMEPGGWGDVVSSTHDRCLLVPYVVSIE